MASKFWNKFISESVYKTPITTLDGTTLNTGWAPLDLPDDDAVNVQRRPVIEQLMTAKSRGGPDRGIGDAYGISGDLRGLLYPEQAALVAAWGLVVVDQVPTPKLPWVTTEPNGDLASITLVSGYEDVDFNLIKRRARGLKCASFVLEAARATRGGVVQWTASAVGADEVTAAADTEPTLAQFPGAALAPYYISNAAITINNVVISNFESFRLSATNTLEAMFDESPTAQKIRMQSRTVQLSVTGALKSTPDWEALFTGQTLLATTKLVLTHPGNNHRITCDLQGAARVPNWTPNRRLQARNNQTIEITAQLDRSTGKDFTCVFDDPTP